MTNNITNISDDLGQGKEIEISKDEILDKISLLEGVNIGISISESEDLSRLGYGIFHIKDAIIEVARYLINSGAVLLYGGDMRPNGFTEIISELVLYYRTEKKALSSKLFYNYLAYPISISLSNENEAKLKNKVSFIRVQPPDDLGIQNVNEYVPLMGIEDCYLWSRCLSKMRDEMDEKSDARIFIGGKINGFKGIYPGVFEEFLSSFFKDKPVYLVGAFGGVTKEIINLLLGEETTLFNDEFYSVNENYQELINYYNNKNNQNQIDPSSEINRIKNLGIDKLVSINGLSLEENKRLFVTPHINEAIFLILKGLMKINSNNS